MRIITWPPQRKTVAATLTLIKQIREDRFILGAARLQVLVSLESSTKPGKKICVPGLFDGGNRATLPLGGFTATAEFSQRHCHERTMLRSAGGVVDTLRQFEGACAV